MLRSPRLLPLLLLSLLPLLLLLAARDGRPALRGP
jgi:hypothetical protein